MVHFLPHRHDVLRNPLTFLRRCVLTLFLMAAIPALAANFPYDERTNARIDLTEAMRKARDNGKNMLVVYGANWCADCLRLDSRIHDDNGLLGDERFVIVKVDVGRFDKNTDLAAMHGNPISKGIPGAAIVSPDGKTLYSGPLINLLEPYQFAKRLLRYTGGILGILLAAAILLVILRRARLARRPANTARHAGISR